LSVDIPNSQLGTVATEKAKRDGDAEREKKGRESEKERELHVQSLTAMAPMISGRHLLLCQEKEKGCHKDAHARRCFSGI
jgi:hypothetical protein